MFDRISVLITGVGGGGHGEQILKALRMSSLNLEITGTDTNAHSHGFANVDRAYVVPPASHPNYISRLLDLCKRHRVQVLFHGSEPELKAMSRHRDQIQAEGILLPVNDAEVIERCMDKSQTMAFLSDNHFSFPKSIAIDSPVQLDQVDSFPAVMKPIRGSGGSAHVYIVQDRAELHLLSEYLFNLNTSFMVQEYVGTPDQEYTVGVLHSQDGDLIGSIALRRFLDCALSKRLQVSNRTSRAELGPNLVVSSGVSQGEIGDFPQVTEFCEQVATRLGSRGPLNIQCRQFQDRIYVFEINPRFSGTTSLRAMAGFNEPELMIRKHLLGETLPTSIPISKMVITRGIQEERADSTRVIEAK